MAFLFRDYWPKPDVGYLSIHNFGNGADGKPYSFIISSNSAVDSTACILTLYLYFISSFIYTTHLTECK